MNNAMAKGSFIAGLVLAAIVVSQWNEQLHTPLDPLELLVTILAGASLFATVIWLIGTAIKKQLTHNRTLEEFHEGKIEP